MASPLQGQQSTGCRKTCGKGAKRTQILAMGCSTPGLALGQGSPGCRFNGRFFVYLAVGEARGALRTPELVRGGIPHQRPQTAGAAQRFPSLRTFIEGEKREQRRTHQPKPESGIDCPAPLRKDEPLQQQIRANDFSPLFPPPGPTGR
jgi:hypothetical protein